jgi:hypothetical protein
LKFNFHFEISEKEEKKVLLNGNVHSAQIIERNDGNMEIGQFNIEIGQMQKSSRNLNHEDKENKS